MSNYQQIKKAISGNVTDVDTKKGITCGYFSVFGNEDSDGDIVSKGAFAKSIQENGPDGTGRIKHLLDHHKVIGKLQTLKEDSKGLYYESQITKAPRGVDFLIMCEEGIITEHSFMGYIIKWERNPKDPENGMVLKEIALREGSSMELWGANPEAKMTSIKGEAEALEALQKAMKIGSLSDDTLKGLTDLYEIILKQRKDTQPPNGTVPTSEGLELINFFKTLT